MLRTTRARKTTGRPTRGSGEGHPLDDLTCNDEQTRIESFADLGRAALVGATTYMAYRRLRRWGAKAMATTIVAAIVASGCYAENTTADAQPSAVPSYKPSSAPAASPVCDKLSSQNVKDFAYLEGTSQERPANQYMPEAGCNNTVITGLDASDKLGPPDGANVVVETTGGQWVLTPGATFTMNCIVESLALLDPISSSPGDNNPAQTPEWVVVPIDTSSPPEGVEDCSNALTLVVG